MKIKVFGVHLSSNNYNKELSYNTPDKISGLSGIVNYFNSIGDASVHRLNESDSIIKCFQSGDMVIILGDFNDVYGSPPLSRLAKCEMKDAWWTNGVGYGATIHKPLPYRIDHILYSASLSISSIKKVEASTISDHDALVAGFNLTFN